MKHILAYLTHHKFLRMTLLVLGSFLIPVAILLVVVFNNAYINFFLGLMLFCALTLGSLFFAKQCYNLAYECLFDGDDAAEIGFGIFFALGGAFCVGWPIFFVVEYFRHVL